MDSSDTQEAAAPSGYEVKRFIEAAADDNVAEVAKLILRHGKTIVNAKDRNGWTALMTAARKGYVQIVEVLLQQGASIDERLDYNKGIAKTARMMAEQNGHDKVVALLDQWPAMEAARQQSMDPQYTDFAKGLEKPLLVRPPLRFPRPR